MIAATVKPAGNRVIPMAIVAVIAGGIVAALAWRQAPERWLHSYLVAWLYWAGLSLGSIALLLLHNLTGGRWGDLARPVLRAAAGTLPLAALLFLPIAMWVEDIYPWADAYHAEHDHALQHKRAYLNVDAFQIRAGVYFAVWLALLLLIVLQTRWPSDRESRAFRHIRRFSGQGLALYGLAVTFASVDWIMSLEPHWFSTIFGVIVFASQGLASHAFAIAILCAIFGRAGTISELERDALHDLGKLLLGYVMFWTYVSFAQFLIIWYGNLPEEVVWYHRRTTGGWYWVALSLLVFHFAVPFMVLLSRNLKRSPRMLGSVATLLLIMHWFEAVWLVQPAVAEYGKYRPWLDVALTAAIGGLWCLSFYLSLHRRPMLLGEMHTRHG